MNDPQRYFLSLAANVARGADCNRARHGAVLVDVHGVIVGTGFNASALKSGSCTMGRCPRGQLTEGQLAHLAGGYDDPASPGFCTAIHAEANALLTAGRDRARGATMYVTGEPCHGCWKLMQECRVARVYWGDQQRLVTHP